MKSNSNNCVFSDEVIDYILQKYQSDIDSQNISRELFCDPKLFNGSIKNKSFKSFMDKIIKDPIVKNGFQLESNTKKNSKNHKNMSSLKNKVSSIAKKSIPYILTSIGGILVGRYFLGKKKNSRYSNDYEGYITNYDCNRSCDNKIKNLKSQILGFM